MATITYLADVPQHLDQVTDWILAEWGRPGVTRDMVYEKYRAHMNTDRLPLSLVAVIDERPVGTASLRRRDLQIRPHLVPWLASVYVASEYRNQGIGSQLVIAAETEAARLDIETLYLFTPDRDHFYARLGWRTIEQTDYRGEQVVVMKKILAPRDRTY